MGLGGFGFGFGIGLGLGRSGRGRGRGRLLARRLRVVRVAGVVALVVDVAVESRGERAPLLASRLRLRLRLRPRLELRFRLGLRLKLELGQRLGRRGVRRRRARRLRRSLQSEGVVAHIDVVDGLAQQVHARAVSIEAAGVDPGAHAEAELARRVGGAAGRNAIQRVAAQTHHEARVLDLLLGQALHSLGQAKGKVAAAPLLGAHLVLRDGLVDVGAEDLGAPRSLVFDLALQLRVGVHDADELGADPGDGLLAVVGGDEVRVDGAVIMLALAHAGRAEEDEEGLEVFERVGLKQGVWRLGHPRMGQGERAKDWLRMAIHQNVILILGRGHGGC
ncbi:hypothetical protein BKA80DRAFT_277388 [Phyllosticta citrichinensis]